MRLIGAGLPRTATSTQSVALPMLGYGPCYHMQDLLMNMDEQVPMWTDALEGRGDWNALFDGFDSTVDWPAAFFWRELIDVYPDAKVLLSVRDAEGWARSMFDTIWQIYYGDSVLHHVCQARRTIDPSFRAWYDLMVRMCWATGAPFAGAHTDREDMMAAMERWNDEVKSTVPSDRLLVWNPKEGWDPLCEFLGVDVPDEPLPQVNDTQAFKDGITGGALAAVTQWFESEDRGRYGGKPMD